MKCSNSLNRVVCLAMVLLISCIASLSATESIKPRVIATTDGERDDQSSMVRFLMYASDYDIAGIVQVNGVQKSGHSKDKWIEKLVEKYDQCLPNLRKHRPDYPSTEYLLSVLTVGNENRHDLRKAPPLLSDSEGAQLIIRTLLDDDPRPVHILAWGGANTQANALWQIKEKYSVEEWQRAAAKARLYCIWFQDGGGKWIVENLPEVKIYGASAPKSNGGWRYVWDYMSVDGKFKGRMSKNPRELQTIMDTPWLMEHIKQGHGPLAAAYSQDYTSEGDSPSFMPLIANGLDQHKDYTLGGWGGRPNYTKGNFMENGSDELNGKPNSHYTFQRWLPAAQNDWAARADWCVKSYDEANHQPVIKLAHACELDVRPGERVSLSAKGTTDPDGDELTYRWWQYREAGSYDGSVQIQNADKPEASFIVPADVEKKGTIPIICEVTDNGTPPLKRYQRVFVEVKP